MYRIHFPAVHGQTCVQIFIDTGRSHDLDFPQVSDLAVDMDVVISGTWLTGDLLGIQQCSSSYH